eukprot:tig00021348_g20574.t1
MGGAASRAREKKRREAYDTRPEAVRLHRTLTYAARLQAFVRERIDSNAYPDTRAVHAELAAAQESSRSNSSGGDAHVNGSRRGRSNVVAAEPPPEPPPTAAAACEAFHASSRALAGPLLYSGAGPQGESTSGKRRRHAHSAREGLEALLTARLSLPALAALVNHASFAAAPERWAPALLGLALGELSDRGMVRLLPPPPSGVLHGDGSWGDFEVELVEGRLPEPGDEPLPGALHALVAFVRGQGGAAGCFEVCRAFLAQRAPEADPELEGVNAIYSRLTGIVTKELTDGGLKRRQPERAGPGPTPPPLDLSKAAAVREAELAAAEGHVLLSPSCALTSAGRRAAVAAAVLAGALWEAEARHRALSRLAPELLVRFLATPLYDRARRPVSTSPAAELASTPEGAAAGAGRTSLESAGGAHAVTLELEFDTESAILMGAAVLLAVPPRLRPRFWAQHEEARGGGPLPGLGRFRAPAAAGAGAGPPRGLSRVLGQSDSEEFEAELQLLAVEPIDAPDALARVLLLAQSAQPWGEHMCVLPAPALFRRQI